MLRRVLSLLLPLVVLAACSSESPSSDETPNSARLSIVCTTGMITDVTERIVADLADVTGLCGPGVDPHTYKATRRDVEALQGADVVLYNGLGLEARMADVLVRLAVEGGHVVAVTSQLDDDFLLTPEEFDGHEDPHVWNDPASWLSAIEVIAASLSEAAPQHASTFADNASALSDEIRAMRDFAQECYASIPSDQRVLITSHDAFNYLGRAFDIEVLGVQGVTTESEAGLADIERLVDLIATRKIGAIFTENITTDHSIRALVEGCEARGWTVAIGGEVFSDAFGAPGTYEGTYLGMIDHNATVITRGLGGTAPERGRDGKLSAE